MQLEHWFANLKDSYNLHHCQICDNLFHTKNSSTLLCHFITPLFINITCTVPKETMISGFASWPQSDLQWLSFCTFLSFTIQGIFYYLFFPFTPIQIETSLSLKYIIILVWIIRINQSTTLLIFTYKWHTFTSEFQDQIP